jgi:hypothetical protein
MIEMRQALASKWCVMYGRLGWYRDWAFKRDVTSFGSKERV